MRPTGRCAASTQTAAGSAHMRGPRPGARHRAVAVLMLVCALVVSACGAGSSDVPGAEPDPPRETVLNVFSFAVAKPGYDALIEAWEQSPHGDEVTVLTSFGASGDQSRKIVAGAPADVAHLSITPDITRIEEAGMAPDDWDAGPYGGSPMGSVVVFVVREGNPLNIQTWDDLLAEDVEVVSPNPLSSGAAQWNLIAPYAVKSRGGQDPQAGIDYVEELVTDHIFTRPVSGAEATATFRAGQGDVLISYEYEAITAQRAGDDFDYVIPAETLQVDNPIAPVTTSPHLDQAQQFVDFTGTVEAQRALAGAGFRPRHPTVVAEYADTYPEPDQVWTLEDLGGWPQVTADLFDDETGQITAIYREATDGDVCTD